MVKKVLDHEALKKFLGDELYKILVAYAKKEGETITFVMLIDDASFAYSAFKEKLGGDKARNKAKSLLDWAKQQQQQETMIEGDLLKEFEEIAQGVAGKVVAKFPTLEKLAGAKDLDLMALITTITSALPKDSGQFAQVISLGVRAWAGEKLGRFSLGGVNISGGILNVSGGIVGRDKIG